jgi:hypothetical protein
MKSTLTKKINAFNKLLSRLDMAEERILELEAMSIVTFETENQIENRLMKRKRM